MCQRPILIHRYNNKRRTKFIKDDNVDIVKVPCGKCPECQKKRRFQWMFRISEAEKYAKTSSFITLTYDDEHVTEELNSDHIKKFFKGLRNDLRNEKGKFKYLAVGEHGDAFGRCHWHIIFLYDDYIPLLDFMQLVYNRWDKGFVFFGSVTPASVMYCAKYCIKDLRSEKGVVVLISKNLGEQYIKANKDLLKRNLQLYGVLDDGRKVALPRCWKNKIFNKAEYDEALDYFLLAKEEDQIDYRKDFYNRKQELTSQQIYINTRKQKLIKNGK